MSSNNDAVMSDTNLDIRQKLLNLMGSTNPEAIEGSFKFEDYETEKLRSLNRSQAQPVVLDQNVGTEPPHHLHRYDISVGDNKEFLDLTCHPRAFYSRRDYEELYDCVAGKWSSDMYRVVLIGNAGIGKSWFQIYALRKLLDSDNKEYDIVIRQVNRHFYVIDLAEATVYSWKTTSWETTADHIISISKRIKRALYFFEPGGNAHMPPLEVFMPSLSTLSPFEDRIKEYSKRLCSRLYFWPWSFWEMWAVVCDRLKSSLDFDEFISRYNLFGGILRNVLGEDQDAESKLNARLKQISVDVLTSIELNIDREVQGDNVSGYLVCYDNRCVEGADRFSAKNLKYTSLKVEEGVAERIHTKPLAEKMQAILDRLDGRIIDISGKMLEDVAMKLLSQGTDYAWQSCEVGTAVWLPFSTTKRDIKRTYTLAENFKQPACVIAPSNMRFPGVDFVFSCPDTNSQNELPVVGFQCTWASTHPLTVRALYDLRRNHMAVKNDRIVEIYIISPSNDGALTRSYASKPKAEFLKGSLDDDLQFSKTVVVPSGQLQAMWNSTKIFVVCPNDSWHDSIEKWLSNK